MLLNCPPDVVPFDDVLAFLAGGVATVSGSSSLSLTTITSSDAARDGGRPRPPLLNDGRPRFLLAGPDDDDGEGATAFGGDFLTGVVNRWPFLRRRGHFIPIGRPCDRGLDLLKRIFGLWTTLYK